MQIRAIQPETQALIDYLTTVPEGTTVTYEQIAQAVGYPVIEHPGRSRLAQARKALMRDQQRVFATLLKVGLKALSDCETVHAGAGKLREVRSAARRAKRITLSVKDYEALPPVEKSRSQAVLAVTSAVEAMASRRSMAKLMGGPESVPALPNMREVLELAIS
jgi:hypothetical protein